MVRERSTAEMLCSNQVGSDVHLSRRVEVELPRKKDKLPRTTAFQWQL